MAETPKLADVAPEERGGIAAARVAADQDGR